MSSTYADAIVVDGLEIAKWSREVFTDMRDAGITAVNCTCSVWEGFEGTMQNVAEFKGWFREYDDLIRPVKMTADIEAAKSEGRVGIILGWQNIAGIEDQLPYLELFRELGIRIIQLAYNTQNFVATGCYESTDPGLSDFGREVIAEMNRLGILIDLSHVGVNTTRDAIEASEKPVVFSHTCPRALRDHVRNKTDDEMRAVVERGGLVGLTLFPWFLAAGDDATIEDYVDAIEYVVNLVGEDNVGIGTDFIDGHGEQFLEWLLRDKGYARPLVDSSVPKALSVKWAPKGISGIRDFPKIDESMEKRGWSDERREKILGRNWMRVLREVWGE